MNFKHFFENNGKDRIRRALSNIKKRQEYKKRNDEEEWINKWYKDNGYTWDNKLQDWVPPKRHNFGGYERKTYKPEPCNASWVKKGYLARSCRPGYPTSKNIDENIAEEWLECVENKLGMKPKTIITFLHGEELYGKDYKLGFYNFNLLDWYKQHGIETKWFPTKDPIYDPNVSHAFTEEKLNEIMKAIETSPKPVLIHCSAGIDRTGEVVYFFEHGKPKPEFNSFKNYRSSKQNQVDKFRNKYGWDYGSDNSMITYGD